MVSLDESVRNLCEISRDLNILSDATKIQLERVKDELLSLKNSGVELNYYTAVVNQLETRAIVHLTNEPFYVEIDAAMQHHLETTKHFSLNTQPVTL